MFKIQNWVPEDATEITIQLGWDNGDGTNAGFTAHVGIQSGADCVANDSIILDDDYLNQLELKEVVGHFSTEYLPPEFHDINRWDFTPLFASVQIPVEYLK
jgi:hypothetical protein|tara:strand:+ start:2334 stop:2636 length:303 start_codon:yes stop_codon:yes gene_type:complete